MAGRQEKIMKSFFYLLGLLLLTWNAQANECPRIISQSPYITHSLKWLGLEKCIVGVSRYDRIDRPHTGGISNPDKEAIDSLMPDIIFTSNRTKSSVLNDVTPQGTQAYRLNGFNTMQQIENNLLTIGKAAGIKNISTRIDEFHHDWQKAIKQIDAQGKKVLLISSCSGSPYSFGKQTWLYDLFSQAGFDVVETHDKIRHIKKGKEIEAITGLLDRFKPEVLFIFERTLNTQCNLIMPKTPVRIVAMDGEHFLNPAPVLLKGLDELYQKKVRWQ